MIMLWNVGDVFLEDGFLVVYSRSLVDWISTVGQVHSWRNFEISVDNILVTSRHFERRCSVSEGRLFQAGKKLNVYKGIDM